MLKSLMFKMFRLWDLSGNPVVQTPLSNVVSGSSIPLGLGELRRLMTQSKNPKHMTEVTNSIKDFKNGPDKRILKNKMCWLVCVVLSC